jgi:hypothetical protein
VSTRALKTCSAFLIVAGAATVTGATRSQPGIVTVDLRSATPPSIRTARSGCLEVGTPASGIAEGFSSVSSAARLSNGTIVVFNAASRQLLYFDAMGKLSGRAGGIGQGPGEFGSPYPRLYPYRGDSVIVLDIVAHEMSVFGPSGEYARSMHLPRPATGRATNIVGALAHTGAIVATQRTAYHPPVGLSVYADSFRIVVLDPLGIPYAESAPLPDVLRADDMTATPTTSTRGSQAFRMRVNLVSPGPVSRAGRYAQDGASIATAGNAIYHFEEPHDVLAVHSPSGQMIRRVLLPPLDAALRPASDRVRPQDEAQLLEVRADHSGRAWVELARTRLDAPRRWWIVSPVGRLESEVSTPARQRLLDAGADYVLLLRMDANDVETVTHCRLTP